MFTRGSKLTYLYNDKGFWIHCQVTKGTVIHSVLDTLYYIGPFSNVSKESDIEIHDNTTTPATISQPIGNYYVRKSIDEPFINTRFVFFLFFILFNTSFNPIVFFFILHPPLT